MNRIERLLVKKRGEEIKYQIAHPRAIDISQSTIDVIPPTKASVNYDGTVQFLPTQTEKDILTNVKPTTETQTPVYTQRLDAYFGEDAVDSDSNDEGESTEKNQSKRDEIAADDVCKRDHTSGFSRLIWNLTNFKKEHESASFCYILFCYF